MEEPGLLEHTTQEIQRGVTLNGGMVQPELYFTDNEDSTGEIWYLNNGVSNHITRDWLKFKDIDQTFTGKVRFGDGSTVEIQGKGTIVFQGRTGDQWVLRDVYFIPKLRANLISLGQLIEIGHRVVMDDDEIIVSEKYPPRLIMCVQRTTNRLYKIELNTIDPACLLASLEDQGWLWHGRLGHVNFQAMRKLVDKDKVGGVPLV
jgi:hypothetical protein